MIPKTDRSATVDMKDVKMKKIFYLFFLMVCIIIILMISIDDYRYVAPLLLSLVPFIIFAPSIPISMTSIIDTSTDVDSGINAHVDTDSHEHKNAVPQSFLPLRFPHRYGFCLPIIFSYLSETHFSSLRQTSNHSAWQSSLIDPISTQHYTYTIDNTDSLQFTRLSPLFISSLHKIIISNLTLPDPSHDGAVPISAILHRKWLSEMKNICRQMTHSHLLREMEIHLTPRWIPLAFVTSEGIQRIIEYIMTMKRQMQNNHLSLSAPSPLILTIEMHFAVPTLFQLMVFMRENQQKCDELHLTVRWNIQCNYFEWDTMKQFIDMGEGRENKSKIEFKVSDQRHQDKEGKDITNRQAIDSLSPSPSPHPFSPLVFITRMIISSPLLTHHGISTLIPLHCPLLSSLSFLLSGNMLNRIELWEEMGMIIHNARKSLTNIRISCYGALFINENVVSMSSFCTMISSITSQLTEAKYPQITQFTMLCTAPYIDLFAYLDNYYKGYHDNMAHYTEQMDREHLMESAPLADLMKTFGPFVGKFPNLFLSSSTSPVPVDNNHFLWYIYLLCHSSSTPLLSSIRSVSLGPFYESTNVSIRNVRESFWLRYVPMCIGYLETLETLRWNGLMDRVVDANEEEEKSDNVMMVKSICLSLSHCHSLTSVTIVHHIPSMFLTFLAPSLFHCPMLKHLEIQKSESSGSLALEEIKALADNTNNFTHKYFTSLSISALDNVDGVDCLITMLSTLPLLTSLHCDVRQMTGGGGGNQEGKEREREFIVRGTRLVETIAKMKEMRNLHIQCDPQLMTAPLSSLSSSSSSSSVSSFLHSLCHSNRYLKDLTFTLEQHDIHILSWLDHLASIFSLTMVSYLDKDEDKTINKKSPFPFVYLRRIRFFHRGKGDKIPLILCENLENQKKNPPVNPSKSLCPQHSKVRDLIDRLHQVGTLPWSRHNVFENLISTLSCHLFEHERIEQRMM